MSLLEERRGHLLVLTIDRPTSANALDGRTGRQLTEACQRADEDEGVRSIVLTGTGDRAFCAGRDLRDLPDPEGEDPSVALVVARTRTPLIAAVNGAAVGGGFELALACDLVLAVDGARFGFPEVARGFVATDGGTDLPRRLPLPLAMELLLTGELIDASRAHELGLVNRVVAREHLVTEALALADRIAANAPIAVQQTKRLLRHSIEVSEEDMSRLRQEAMRTVLASEDIVEGARAFVEARAPQWTGR